MIKEYRGMGIGVVMGILLLVSCRKDPLNHLSNDESRIYVTNYDTTANFSGYSQLLVSPTRWT